MAEDQGKCDVCGVNLALVGRSHRCHGNSPAGHKREAAPELVAPVDVSAMKAEVNAAWDAVNAVNTPSVAVNKPAVNTVNKRRGKYPDSAKRREYMREYMRKKRTFGKGKI